MAAFKTLHGSHMSSYDLIRRHAELIQAREHGLWQTLGAQETREIFLEDLNQLVELSSDRDTRAQLTNLPRSELWNAIIALLGDADNVASKGSWTLYWALSQAVHGLLPYMRLGMHEPALTGVLMANLRYALSMGGGVNDGEVVAVHIADHQALWNESKSGADFGLIVETVRNGTTHYMTTLFQAKRAGQRRVRIDLKQAEKLNDSHIGAYLFYNEFSLEEKEYILPTVKLTDLVCDEAKGNGSADAIRGARDFAMATGFGVPSRKSAIGGDYLSPEDAIEALFNVEIEQQLNHLLVTVVGEQLIPAHEIVRREREWRTLVERAMFNRFEGRAPFEDAPAPGT